MRPFTEEPFAAWPAWKRWRYAAKPASWPKLLVPTALGQALGIAAGGRSVGALVWGLCFAVFDLTFVVFLNDWGDREVDAIKRRMFPRGCSPKTIPDAILPPHQLLVAGLAAGTGAMLLAVVGARLLARPLLPFAAAGCLALFAAYSLPPLRLNYRGGGELVEMLGVGLGLPLLNAYVQAAEATDEIALGPLAGFALLSMSSALASGLSDETSDRAGGKRTVAAVAGNRVARRFCEASAILGVFAWLVAASPSTLLGAVIAGYHVWGMQKASEAAVTDAFAAQAVYKRHLHRAIWHGAVAVAVFEVIWSLVS